jgi:catechol 2,3-dioxygenase-like lactoylglutathione lyase family enzyme
MPSCLIRGVRSVELATTNIEEAARFYENTWMLKPVEMPPPFPPPLAGEGREGARFFRGTAGYHHLLGLHIGGRPAVVRLVFDVADRKAIDALHKTIAAAGGKPSTSGAVVLGGGGYGFGCKDPDGRNLAFVCEASDHADTADEPDRPRKIVHVNLNARDFDASLKFFTDVLGFRVVDDNAPLWFLHCDNTDHSSIVLAKTDLPTLNHVAFEMPGFDSVMRGMGRMKDYGYPIEWGPGRHGPGDNVFAYFCGPDEVPLEYAAEVLQIDDSYQPRPSSYWKYAPGRSDQWGVTQPRSARYYRVQRLFGFTADGDRVN